MKKILGLMIFAMSTIACARPHWEANGEGFGLANLIALCTVSFFVGFGAYKWAKSAEKYTEEQEAWIAVIAGLVGGPIISWMLFL